MEPQIEITADDLQAVLAMAEIAVRHEGRKVLRLTEPTAQKIERYFEAMTEYQKAKAEQPASEAEQPVTDKAE